MGARLEDVEGLARLCLQLRRLRLEFRLTNVEPGLAELIAFLGLAEALRLESWREVEDREQPRRVEEEGEL